MGIIKRAKQLKFEEDPAKKRMGVALDLTKKEKELLITLRQVPK